MFLRRRSADTGGGKFTGSGFATLVGGALILNEMIKHARQVIAVADASKLGMISAMRVCSSNQIHSIITDDSADPAVVKQFKQQGVRIVAV